MEGQSPSRALPKACVWIGLLWQAIRKRGLESGLQASLPSIFQALFLRASRPAGRSSRSFLPQQKRRSLPHEPPKRQSAGLFPAGLRSKLKKTEKIMGSSLLASLRFSVFFNQLPRLNCSQRPQRLVLWYFLGSRKYRPLRLRHFKAPNTSAHSRTKSFPVPLRSTRWSAASSIPCRDPTWESRCQTSRGQRRKSG